ncbi:hypothetical protein CANTEDRAFT_112938, partial [Yamadazyma tenuis ATCC 10573]
MTQNIVTFVITGRTGSNDINYWPDASLGVAIAKWALFMPVQFKWSAAAQRLLLRKIICASICPRKYHC